MIGIAGEKAEKPQDAQIIFGDPGAGLADEADHPGGEIGAAIEIIMDCTGWVHRHRIDGEIATGGVNAPVIGECDGRVAAISVEIAAQAGDFDGLGVEQGGECAVIESGRDGANISFGEAGLHQRRGERDREIDIGDRQSHEPIADGAADDARFGQNRPETDQGGVGAQIGGHAGRLQGWCRQVNRGCGLNLGLNNG